MKIWLFSFINSGGKLCRIENIMTNQWIDEQALVRTLMKTIETYEAAGDPRMRYQAAEYNAFDAVLWMAEAATRIDESNQ